MALQFFDVEKCEEFVRYYRSWEAPIVTKGCPIVDPNRKIHNMETLDVHLIIEMIRNNGIRETKTKKGERIFLQTRRNCCVFCGGERCLAEKNTRTFEDMNYLIHEYACNSRNEGLRGKKFFTLHFMNIHGLLRPSDTCFICGSDELKPCDDAKARKDGRKWDSCINCGYEFLY